jgi:primosomal replication protein N
LEVRRYKWGSAETSCAHCELLLLHCQLQEEEQQQQQAVYQLCLQGEEACD